MRSMRVLRPFLLLLALSPISLAQDDLYGPSPGEFLLGFTANYRYAKASAVSSDADETELFTGRGALSVFLEREHELGFELVPSIVRQELGGDSFDLFVGAFYNYNLWTSPQTTFYAGPQLGIFHSDPSGSSSDTAFSWGLHAGMRYWFDPRIAFEVEPRISFTYLDDSLGGDQTIFDLLFGITVRL